MKKKRPQKKVSGITRQRQEILSLLMGTSIHPSAEWIYTKLKKKIKGLTIAGVNKNLRLLKEEGKIWELDFGTGMSRFSALMHSHYHFLCSGCQTIYDIKIPPMKELEDKASQLTGFRIISHRLEFFGLCDVCKEKNKIKVEPQHEIKKP